MAGGINMKSMTLKQARKLAYAGCETGTEVEKLYNELDDCDCYELHKRMARTASLRNRGIIGG